jgi:hypothetical protein
MTERLVEAFGVHPIDLYATIEGIWGVECERHEGIHLFEDMALLENVDKEGQPVPEGEPGAKLLVTNLSNLVQPIIRLEVSDILTLESEPCRCGRTLVRAQAIEGRSDDVLRLPGQKGGEVAVHPIEFGIVTRDRDVREYQVLQEGSFLRILVVPGCGRWPRDEAASCGVATARGARGRGAAGHRGAPRGAGALGGRQATDGSRQPGARKITQLNDVPGSVAGDTVARGGQ